MTLKKQDRQKK